MLKRIRRLRCQRHPILQTPNARTLQEMVVGFRMSASANLSARATILRASYVIPETGLCVPINNTPSLPASAHHEGRGLRDGGCHPCEVPAGESRLGVRRGAAHTI